MMTSELYNIEKMDNIINNTKGISEHLLMMVSVYIHFELSEF